MTWNDLEHLRCTFQGQRKSLQVRCSSLKDGAARPWLPGSFSPDISLWHSKHSQTAPWRQLRQTRPARGHEHLKHCGGVSSINRLEVSASALEIRGFGQRRPACHWVDGLRKARQRGSWSRQENTCKAGLVEVICTFGLCKATCAGS